MAENCCILVHYNGEVSHTAEGVTFTSVRPICVIVHPTINFSQLQWSIQQQLGQENNIQITEMLYRLPIAILQGVIKYASFPICNDNDVSMMFNFQARFPEIRIMEMFITFQENQLSSGGSNPLQLAAGPSSSLNQAPAINNPEGGREHVGDLVASPSFTQLPEPLIQGEPIAGLDYSNFIEHGEDVDEEQFDGPVHNESDEGSDREIEESSQDQPLMSQSLSQSQSQGQPSHYSTLNLDGMNLSSVGSGPAGIVGSDGKSELEVGQLFRDKEAVLFAIKNYNIRRSAEYKVYESDHIKYHDKCVKFGSGCNWSIRVTYRRKMQMWEVRRYNGPHTYVFDSALQGHRQLDSDVICASILSMVEKDLTISIKILQGAMESRFKLKSKYMKVWYAKQKAIAKIYGDWEDSYKELPRWLLGLQCYMPGTIVHLLTQPYYVGNIIDQNRVIFHRLFWTFPQCMEAFKYCKLFISIDGTHLYGKYSGTLLMTIAQDGNSNILPVAFALVEGKTKEGWCFFLSNLRQYVTPQEGILVISDKHESIKAALDAEGSRWHPPMAHHAYCIRHICSNFAIRFKNKDAKRILVNAAYSKTRRDFLYYYGLLRNVNPEMGEWVDRIPHAQWTQYANEGRRFGHMTTNLSECMNAIMKGIHNLPITAIVKSTYFRLAELFVKKRMEAQAQIAAGRKWSEALLRAIDLNSQHLSMLDIGPPFSRANLEFMVSKVDTGDNFRVNLAERFCDCGYFQALHYPCRHALKACWKARVEWGSYTHEAYSLDQVFKVYIMEFRAIGNDDSWPAYTGAAIVPNPTLRRGDGRPVSTRRRNEMDEVEPNRIKCCGLCRQPGHTRCSCPALASASSSHNG